MASPPILPVREEGREGEGGGGKGGEGGGGPQESLRIATEPGVSGEHGENKSQVCCFRDVNQIME